VQGSALSENDREPATVILRSREEDLVEGRRLPGGGGDHEAAGGDLGIR